MEASRGPGDRSHVHNPIGPDDARNLAEGSEPFHRSLEVVERTEEQHHINRVGLEVERAGITDGTIDA